MSASNGENDFDVSFGRIMFLQRILESHPDVIILNRRDDIVFEIARSKQRDSLTLVCIDEYTLSLETAMRVVAEFPDTNIIFVGGKWNGYTKEAFEFCQKRNIGVYNAGELAGALHRKSYWSYEKFDEDGKSLRSIKG